MIVDPATTANSQNSTNGLRASIGGGYSVQDVNRFENAYADASARLSSTTSQSTTRTEGIGALQTLISPLSNLNAHSEKLKAEAESAIGENLKPSELMMLTMHTHQFMFHCQLTANVANRSSDGIQQLFRQQS